jgi:hypothetical protein
MLRQMGIRNPDNKKGKPMKKLLIVLLGIMVFVANHTLWIEQLL